MAVTDELKLGKHEHVDVHLKSGNTRRIRIDLRDLDDESIDANTITDAWFAVHLQGGTVALRLNNGIVIDQSSGEARLQVNIEAKDTVGELDQQAPYELVVAIGEDRDSVLFGRFVLEASIAEPAADAAATLPAGSALDWEYVEFPLAA